MNFFEILNENRDKMLITAEPYGIRCVCYTWNGRLTLTLTLYSDKQDQWEEQLNQFIDLISTI